MSHFKYCYFRLTSVCILLLAASCNSDAPISERKSSKPVAPFEIADVALLDGPFKHATELNIETLLGYEPDRFLARFRKQAGLEPKAEQYGGWESE